MKSANINYYLMQWAGSKSTYLDDIYKAFPYQYKIGAFGDVFGGSYSVILNCKWLTDLLQGIVSKKRSPALYVNDKAEGIYALSETLLLNPGELWERINNTIADEELYFNLQNLTIKDNIDKAIIFLYAIKLSLGGKVNIIEDGKLVANGKKTGSFGAKFGGEVITWKQNQYEGVKGVQYMKNLVRRLSYIQRYNKDYKEFIDLFMERGKTLKQKGREKMFLYLDPPYYEMGGATKDFKNFNHEELRAKIQEIHDDGDILFLLSYNDHPWVREQYKDFYIEDFEVAYRMNYKTGRANKKEVLIRNYKSDRLIMKGLGI